MSREVRVLHGHDDLGEEQYHEWWGPKTFRYLDKLARPNKGGLYRWSVWICNNPDCRAEALISDATLRERVSDLLPEVSR